MIRRDFIAGLGSAAAWPLVVGAQQRIHVVGILGTTPAESYRIAAFMQGLKEARFIEGQNVRIEQRWANNQYDRLPEMAADLVRSRVSLRAAKAATSTIPIVFSMGADPVALGIVASLSHPGGNITGATIALGEILQKRFQLLHDVVPTARRFGFLMNPDNDRSANIELARNAVRTWGGTLEVADARTARDFDAAFADFAERHVEAIVPAADALFNSEGERLSRVAAQYAVPVIHSLAASVRTGGLISYSAGNTDAIRQAGVYSGRILKGEEPADLPVVQPTKFELVINLKTAKALGLTIPETLMATADEVIQ
jgi:putative tryptophan/tyrosine transport system substrate-binding protein